MANHVELSPRAERDLRGVSRGAERDRVVRALTQSLTAEPIPQNLDIEALRGRRPWLRLRVGNWRILFRALAAEEMNELRARGPLDGEQGYLVARIVDRRDLQRAVETLA